MELRQLRTFVAVAELRHFAKAASLCNLSQPAVSHQIAVLESELGTKLLNRAPRRVSLTVAGEVFLEEVRRILGAVDRTHERMQEVARGAVGRIRLGATATPGLYLLPPLLARYRAEHPTYDLRFEIGPVHAIAERVARNDLDMAIVAGPLPSAELQARTLRRDEFVVITTAGSKVRNRPVKPNQLETETWLLREEGSDTRRQLSSWWHRHRLSPTRTMTFDGPDAVKRAVMGGLGIAMVSGLTVEDDLASGRLAVVPVKASLPVREFSAIDHPQKHHGAACRAMLQQLADIFSIHGPAPRAAKLSRRDAFDNGR
jgi:DNA-binding transcriptional LysR family regulator